MDSELSEEIEAKVVMHKGHVLSPYIYVWRCVLHGAVYFNDQSINVLFQH